MHAQKPCRLGFLLIFEISMTVRKDSLTKTIEFCNLNDLPMGKMNEQTVGYCSFTIVKRDKKGSIDEGLMIKEDI